MSVIFEASDLNQRGRAILDAARGGRARIRDQDGLGLLLLPEDRVESLETAARYAANVFAIERTLRGEANVRHALVESGEWPWLRVFDVDDLQEFVESMREPLVIAIREGTNEIVEEALYRWKVTAQALEDPRRREILLGRPCLDDFVEVTRPESLEAAADNSTPSDQRDVPGQE